ESNFVLKKPINDLSEIELGYQDYILGFEFAALDFADPMRNKYAYRLLGFNDNWVYTDANNRQATYTNLAAGNYTFQVKAANKDGVWSKTAKELKIIMHPAPWFSPWAYAAYILLSILSIWGFIRYKTIASRKRAVELEKTVAIRTQEVSMQKKMVESLLEHKNEVFANVTHEFKTPLALILGPSEQLANNNELLKHADELNMIQRNAKRLMLMVGQILKLSQAENDKEVIRESQNVKATLLMLYESFRPLALDKNIELNLENNHDVNVYATSECLEIVVGNLISNALKFTNAGGKVSISSKLKDKQISISVQDTGSGIQEKDQDKIFQRFTRLDTHKNIAGTGIGLSVVKEITQANDGQVKVDSIWGKGTTFCISFPTTEIKADEEMSQVMVDQLVANTENELNQESMEETKTTITTKSNIKSQKNRVTVLIIEDNLDMQKHIGKVLSTRFNCLFADRGKAGIAIALEELPDIIVCDVMMPEMDGYQVTRILRHDSRTSHIPIVLLTALNTTESRIKGWRENIDTYMTKPF
ncbi:MAG TPA: response regulator, partial [Oceanospirillales bacterium]|nr:response regulator [Oceanospirillales bacterium]